MSEEKRQENFISPRCLTVRSAAIYLGISVSRLRSLADQIGLPKVRIGGRVLFDRQDIDAFINKVKERLSAEKVAQSECDQLSEFIHDKRKANKLSADDFANEAMFRFV